MKHFLFLTLLLPSFIFGMHHKTNPIIFYLDLDVAEGKSEGVDEFVDYLVAAVKETEPKTMYYKYWISEDKKKVSLIEMYHSNEDAIFHMNAFAEAPHRDKFLETFIVTNFQVLGNTNAELKEVMAEYTRDHRTLVNGFKRKK
jgi:quinol monooxygenase YgiN